jgi:hypothetical protein
MINVSSAVGLFKNEKLFYDRDRSSVTEENVFIH